MGERFGTGLRLFVVDDEAMVRLFLEAALADMGFQVESASSFASGAERCAREAYDLILIDKNLPDGSGLELARELTRSGKDCAVALMSGFANLSSAVEAIQFQVADYFVKPLEIGDLAARLRRIVDELSLKRTNRHLVDELREKNAVLEGLATRDPLTRLFNHAHFQESLLRELARSQRHGLCASLAIIDVDGLKRINDTAGHMRGDEVLREIGALLEADGRQGDLAFRVGKQDLVARFGGDEFAILLPQTPRTGAAVRGERFRQALAGHDFKLRGGGSVTASVGVAQFPEDGSDRDELLAACQVALNAAKATGGDCLVSFATTLVREGKLEPVQAKEETERLAALDRTIATRALRCVYQPIVDVVEWQRFACEALTRPTDPAFKSPLELFAAAERAGRIGDLGRLVREIAVAELPKLPEPQLLFLNLQPFEFLTPGYLESEPALRPHARRLVFEITEGARIHEFERARARVEELKAMGYRVAIDDLGSGYSGLNSLALLAPNFVKLDMEMVRGISADSRSARLIKHLLEFCHEEGLRVIAEGVETAEELATVKGLGVGLVQGYYLARPGPAFPDFKRPA